MAEGMLKKVAVVLVFVLIAALSFTFIADAVSKPDNYDHTVASIEASKDTVLKLTASATVASAAISAIPDDTATPIAEKLADFAEYFLIVLCVLYAEKYLVTIAGVVAFKVLVPIACVFVISGIITNAQSMKRIAIKLMVFAVALCLVTPASIKLNDMVYRSYGSTIEKTIIEAEEFADEAAENVESGNAVSRLISSAKGFVSSASEILNRFIEALAVMIVTSCLIPLLVVAFFMWLINLLTGVNVFDYTPRPRKLRLRSKISAGTSAPHL